MRIFKIEKNRKIIILLIMLLVVPTIISGSIWTFHGKFTVGIVLDEGAELKYAEDAKDGLLLHGEYFEPIILDERFDSSGVKTLYQFYLSKDFNDPEFTRPLRTKYGLHAILIVTEHPLRNWIDNPKVAWGEADPKSASAVMTVFPFRTQSIRDKEARMHNAIHEVSHLLGYMHESLDKDCVMQYAGNGLNYSFYKGFERPYRVTFA
ncbi:MAG: hypothetical protein KAI64_07150, partial [Thermoplasmata archaeon]|nr:hypothetical protein [Thermoplasmata archaeon]